MRKTFWQWIMAWWNGQDHTQDIKLAAFAFVVLAAVVWLSVDLRNGITASWVDAFAWLCALVGLGGAGWSAVEKWKGGGGSATKATAQQRSTDQEGGEA